MGKTVRGLLYFVIIAGVIAALLAGANWLPSRLQKGFAREYKSVDEVKRSLGFDNILVPRYFPEGLSWPPTFIFAQKKPYRAVALEFKAAGSTDTMLIVIQSSMRGRESQLQRIRLSEVKEDVPYLLKGKMARLQVGTCDNGKLCSRISWPDRDLYCTVLFMSSPFELIRIAESMIR